MLHNVRNAVMWLAVLHNVRNAVMWLAVLQNVRNAVNVIGLAVTLCEKCSNVIGCVT